MFYFLCYQLNLSQVQLSWQTRASVGAVICKCLRSFAVAAFRTKQECLRFFNIHVFWLVRKQSRYLSAPASLLLSSVQLLQPLRSCNNPKGTLMFHLFVKKWWCQLLWICHSDTFTLPTQLTTEFFRLLSETVSYYLL